MELTYFLERPMSHNVAEKHRALDDLRDAALAVMAKKTKKKRAEEKLAGIMKMAGEAEKEMAEATASLQAAETARAAARERMSIFGADEEKALSFVREVVKSLLSLHLDYSDEADAPVSDAPTNTNDEPDHAVDTAPLAAHNAPENGEESPVVPVDDSAVDDRGAAAADTTVGEARRSIRHAMTSSKNSSLSESHVDKSVTDDPSNKAETVEAPAAEAPAAEAPKDEAHKAEAPTAGSLAASAPTTDAPRRPPYGGVLRKQVRQQ
jgi:hypothetical protein